MRGLLHLLLLIAVLIVTGCTEKEEPLMQRQAPAVSRNETVPIGQILSSPDRFIDRTVTVEGTVSAGLAFEFVDEQPYRIQDKTGSIWVITKGIMPEDGSTVTVTGPVVSPYQIKGRRYEIVILEETRQ